MRMTDFVVREAIVPDLIAKTKEAAGGATAYVQRLHALDLASGAEKFGGPATIQPDVAFDPLHANQRAALLLSRGVVYVAFAAYGQQSARGWLLGYDAGTLQQVVATRLSDADGAGICAIATDRLYRQPRGTVTRRAHARYV